MAVYPVRGDAGEERRSSLPPISTIFTAPGQYAGALRTNLNRRLSEPGQRGAAVFVLLLAAAVLVVFGYVVMLMLRLPSVEGLEASRYAQSTVVYSEDGVQLARYYRENRTWVSLDSIAPVVVKALIDTEDRRFYDHWGIDITRTFGAMLRTVAGDKQGGSTITMQLVRNAYPEIAEDFVLTRKLEEWLAALQVERKYSKEEILEIYLNSVPFNYNAFGIEAAAQTYYNTSAYQLDTLQSAVLVGMLKGTSLYNPVRNPEAALERRNVVLQQMVEAGTLTPAQYERLSQQGLNLEFSRFTFEQNRAPYFAEYVRNWLDEWAEAREMDIYEAGLRVYTTIDAGLQQEAEQAVREELEQLQAVVDVAWSQPSMPFVSGNPEAYVDYRDRVTPFAYYWEANPDALPAFIQQTEAFRKLIDEGVSQDGAIEQLREDDAFVDSLKTAVTRLQAGLVAIDPANGHVRAWVGGRDFEQSKYDHVAQSQRQPGSTFKPFVYAAALEKGYAPNDYLQDATITYVDPNTGNEWEPGNFGGESGDLMQLQDGLAHSVNTITAQLIIDVGPERVVDLARRAGIRSDLQAVPSLGLGTSVVTLLELVAAYTTFANNGRYQEPVFITRIEDVQGNVLVTFEPETRDALQPAVAYGVLDMMRGVVDEGTGVRIRSQYGIGGDLAGKTGTTQHAADGWFIMMHPELVVGAWIGFPSPAITFRSQYWGQGSHTALRVVGNFASDVDLSPGARFTPPPGYAPPGGEGRLLVVRGNGSEDLTLEEHDVRRYERRGDEDFPAGLTTRELNELVQEDDALVDGDESEGREADGNGQRDGDSGGEPLTEAERETERLNREQQENSAVSRYLRELRKRKQDDDS